MDWLWFACGFFAGASVALFLCYFVVVQGLRVAIDVIEEGE